MATNLQIVKWLEVAHAQMKRELTALKAKGRIGMMQLLEDEYNDLNRTIHEYQNTPQKK